ncbi:hypothetical protein AEGHOMDF_5823 [Methylobacterium soli]|nr:hypothetical protein AEGHOMDF_5823 [Methylobacterium soli]
MPSTTSVVGTSASTLLSMARESGAEVPIAVPLAAVRLAVKL